MLLIGRFLRFLIFGAGIAVGYGVAQFVNGNQSSITVTIWPYTLTVPVYLLALVPLAAGLAAGYLYTAPARAHEFADHWRSWRAMRRMEKENRALRRSLDKVLDLPEDRAAEGLPVVERPVLQAPAEPALPAAGPAAVDSAAVDSATVEATTFDSASVAADSASLPEVKAAGTKRAGRPAPRTAAAKPHAPKANGRVRRHPEPAPAS